MWNPTNWKNVPEFKQEPYFRDLIASLGSSAVYAGTNVDVLTQTSLNEYFSMDRLCDRQERFLWLWHRYLLVAYPVYKDQLDAWTERKLYKWFYDNQKDNIKTHDGTFTLDENTKAELIRAITTKLEATGKSVTDTDRTGETHDSGESHTEDENTSNGTTASNGKDRAFSFNYPESNYTGGVIPYDLENTPAVEFINTQADKVNKNSGTHSDNSSGSTDGTTENNGTSKENIDSTTDTTSNSTGTTDQQDNDTGSKNQNTKTHWEETTTYKGDNIVTITNELLEELPATNFFEQFVNKLKNCFQNDFLFDEIEEGL